jgi:cyanate permease
LRASGQEVKVVFNSTGFHNLLTFLSVLFLALFNNFPKLVRKHVTSLMQLFLGSIVLSQVGEVIRELVEMFYEFIEELLLVIGAV